MEEPKFIVIEGNIGVGKTTLARMLAKDVKGDLLLERFEDNPFLPLFYADANRYAFQLELSFMADRYNQIHESVNFSRQHKQILVSDYYFTKSKIFAGVTLKEHELNLFNRLFEIAHFGLRKPDVFVYLNNVPDKLLSNIRKRGRSYESGISHDYLSKIALAYAAYLEKSNLKVLYVDVEGCDFVTSKEQYDFLKHKIMYGALKVGVTKVSLKDI